MLGSRTLHPSRAFRAAALALTLLSSSAPSLHAQPASAAMAEEDQDDDGATSQPDAALQAGETAALSPDTAPAATAPRR